MKRWMAVLLLASPHIAAAQQDSPFTPNRFDHMLTGSQVRIAASGMYGGSSVDLLAITSAAQIADDFMPADLLLIGGLLPGTSKVEFGARGRAALVTIVQARDWFISASVEAASYGAANIPEDAANLLRKGNVLENAPIDTRNLFARGLVTRELGIGIARRHDLDGITFEAGAAVRHLSPVAFASGRIYPLSEGPALVVDNGQLSAHADVVHSSGQAAGSGYALDLHVAAVTRNLRASLSLTDLGKVRVDARTHHRTLDVQDVSIEELLDAIDQTAATADDQSRTRTLPRRIEARFASAFSRQVSGGLFLRRQAAGDLGIDESTLGAVVGWLPADVVRLRGGLAWIDLDRWALLAGASIDLGRLQLEVSFDADRPTFIDHARALALSTGFAVRF